MYYFLCNGRPAGQKVVHIVFRTILPAHLWGWVGGGIFLHLIELKKLYELQRIE